MTQTETECVLITVGIFLCVAAWLWWTRRLRIFPPPEEEKQAATIKLNYIQINKQIDDISALYSENKGLRWIIAKHIYNDDYKGPDVSLEDIDKALGDYISRIAQGSISICERENAKEKKELRMSLRHLQAFHTLEEHMTQPLNGIVRIVCTAFPLYADVKGDEYKIERTCDSRTSMLGIAISLTEALIALECPAIPKRVIGASVEELFPKAESAKPGDPMKVSSSGRLMKHCPVCKGIANRSGGLCVDCLNTGFVEADSTDESLGPIEHAHVHTDQVPEHPEQNQQKDDNQYHPDDGLPRLGKREQTDGPKDQAEKQQDKEQLKKDGDH